MYSFLTRIPWHVSRSVLYIEYILFRVSDSLLSLTQRLLRILKAVRTPLWRIFPSVYFLPTALWQFGLRSDETVTSQGSRSLATISCSSISFFLLSANSTQKTLIRGLVGANIFPIFLDWTESHCIVPFWWLGTSQPSRWFYIRSILQFLSFFYCLIQLSSSLSKVYFDFA